MSTPDDPWVPVDAGTIEKPFGLGVLLQLPEVPRNQGVSDRSGPVSSSERGAGCIPRPTLAHPILWVLEATRPETTVSCFPVFFAVLQSCGF